MRTDLIMKEKDEVCCLMLEVNLSGRPTLHMVKSGEGPMNAR